MEKWVTLVQEHPKDVIDWASAVHGNKLVICYIHDVKASMPFVHGHIYVQ